MQGQRNVELVEELPERVWVVRLRDFGADFIAPEKQKAAEEEGF
jgi:hypothetical protein